MRRCALIIFVLLLASIPALAKIGTIDLAPAATILVPYWEADTTNPNGVDTLVTIQNASATAVLVHATLWTDYGIPTETFDFYLTGYDQETLSMRDVMQRFIPRTASDGQDPSDTSNREDGISNQGILSQDINFASCNGQLPGNERFLSPQLPLAHLGQPASDYFGAGNCGGRNFADGIARGYLTFDVTNQCACNMTAASPGYFGDGGSSVATNQNILVAEVTFVDAANGRHYAEPAVHIEASSTLAAGPTFYGRFVGNTGIDYREPLPTAWVGKWAGNRTDVEYWRDPGVPVSSFPCGSTPYALDEDQIRAHSDNGAVVATAAGNPFPRAAGVTDLGSVLGLTTGWGSLFLNLNLPAPDGPQGSIRQSWITWRQVPRDQPTNSQMGYSVQGIALGNARTGDDPVLP